jgi:threonine/homoserine/homoserine lactone efflux protein
MQWPLLIRGMVVGRSIAAPVGPIGVLCIRQALSHGFRPAFFSGLGAATADALYGCVAGFGLTAVSGFMLRLIGLRTLRARPATQAASVRGHGAAYASTLLLTLANPTTILSFIAIFAAFGPAAVADYGRALNLVIGIFLGSAAWWLFLSAAVSRARSRASDRTLRVLNLLSGALLVGFGAAALGRALALR